MFIACEAITFKQRQSWIFYLLGLADDSIKDILKELASFHATNYHFVKTYPEGLEKLMEDCPWFTSKTIFDIMGEKMAAMFTTKLRHVQVLLKDSGISDLAETIERQMKTWRQSFEDSQNTSDGSLFKTICHGDLWYSNMMLKWVFFINDPRLSQY